MKIVIISDIHDNIPNLESCLRWCRKKEINTMICCGDVTNIDTIKYLSENFSGTIHLVRGNADNYEEEDLNKFLNIEYYGRMVIIELGDLKIGMCHEPFLIDKVLEGGKCDVVFYGHTYKPWIENRNGINLVNPGNLAGTRNRGTFAHWGSEGLKLKSLDEL